MKRGVLNGVIDKLSREHGMIVLLMSECSSRAWGLAIEDSDYDIRFIYYQLPWRKALEDSQDTIRLTLEVEGVSVDLQGFDLRRAILSIASSNLAVIEMFSSPLRYVYDTVATESLENVIPHYLRVGRLVDSLQGQTKRLWRTGPTNMMSAKHYQYVWRFAMMAEYVRDTGKLWVNVEDLWQPGSVRTKMFAEYRKFDNNQFCNTMINIRTFDDKMLDHFRKSHFFEWLTIFVEEVLSMKVEHERREQMTEFMSAANEVFAVVCHYVHSAQLNQKIVETNMLGDLK